MNKAKSSQRKKKARTQRSRILSGSVLQASSLDSKDLLIISILSENSRMSIADISARTGILRDSVAYRIRRMQHDGIISFPCRINFSKIGYAMNVMLCISLGKHSQQDIQSLKSYLSLQSITYLSFVSGKYDIITRGNFPDQHQLNIFMLGFRQKFSGIIREIEISSIIEDKST